MPERRQWEPLPAEESIERLVDAGLLTERQAEAYVHRAVEGTPRGAAAEHMGISPNTLDNLLATAREKVAAAEATVEAVEDVRHRPLPSTCAECGATLGGSWSENDAGEAICFDCAGVDPETV